MPRATVDINDTQRFELKSCPPDGYVVLRRFSWNEVLARRQMAMNIAIASDDKSKGMQGSVNMDVRATAYFDFKTCIVDHNLTDHADELLDFRKEFTLNLLAGPVGEEISDLIEQINSYDEKDQQNLAN